MHENDAPGPRSCRRREHDRIAGAVQQMNRPSALDEIVPPEVWTAGARFGWKFDEVEPLDDHGVLITLERAESHTTFAIELVAAGHRENSFLRLPHVQVAHRGDLASDASERSWQLALMTFLARAAEQSLANEAHALPALFGVEAPDDDGAPTSPTSCVFATSALNVDPFGEIQPCCMFTRSLADDGGRPFRVPEVPLSRVLSSRDLANVRNALDGGERIQECDRCWRTEQFGRTSKRQGSPVSGRGRPSTPGSTPPLRMLTLYPSNRCNLRCRTCNARSSSSIAAEQKRLIVQHPELAELVGSSLDELVDLSKRSWLQLDADPWAWVREHLADLEQLEFLGGEPLLFHEHFELLAFCVDSGFARRIGLTYSSNGTQLPERARDLWPAFKGVRIQLSLDAVQARFEYLRHPARWHDVASNLHALKELSPRNTEVTANATTSIYNVLYLDELVNWTTEQHVSLSLNPLGSPRHLDPRVLPRRGKKAVRTKLERVSAPPRLATDLATMLDEMDSEDWSDAELPRFHHHTRLLDDARGEDFAKTFPELAALLNER